MLDPNALPPKRKERDTDPDSSYFAPPSQAERRAHLEARGKALLDHGVQSIKVLHEVGDPHFQESKASPDEKDSQVVRASHNGWFDMNDGWKVRVKRAVFAPEDEVSLKRTGSNPDHSQTSLDLEISKFERWGGDGTKDNPGQELPDGKNSTTISITERTARPDQISIRGMNFTGGLGTPFDHRESPHYDEQQNSFNLMYVEGYVDLAQEAVVAIQNAALVAAQANPA